MYKLREAGINSYILNIIDYYLRNRIVYIEIGENRSKSFKPEVGLPQESILAPILFNFYIAEMFQECKGKTEKNADDATHVSAGSTHIRKKVFLISQKIARKLQNGLESGVLKSRFRKQKLSFFQVAVKKSENLQII